MFANDSLPLKSIIVGTAGHIDHGKSALVEALTGTHPDRLAEEKRRGITIDLGFAFLEENGVRFGFVDVPGHERFVSNMLAGAAGLDLVLLVIAADESIKPQTREHFEICRLLGVNRGVVALTKSDLVDADTIELARFEIEDYLRGTFLENAPIVPVSAKTGAGLADLKRELHYRRNASHRQRRLASIPSSHRSRLRHQRLRRRRHRNSDLRQRRRRRSSRTFPIAPDSPRPRRAIRRKIRRARHRRPAHRRKSRRHRAHRTETRHGSSRAESISRHHAHRRSPSTPALSRSPAQTSRPRPLPRQHIRNHRRSSSLQRARTRTRRIRASASPPQRGNPAPPRRPLHRSPIFSRHHNRRRRSPRRAVSPPIHERLRAAPHSSKRSNAATTPKFSPR